MQSSPYLDSLKPHSILAFCSALLVVFTTESLFGYSLLLLSSWQIACDARDQFIIEGKTPLGYGRPSLNSDDNHKTAGRVVFCLSGLLFLAGLATGFYSVFLSKP